PPLAPASPLAGAPEGVHLRAGADGTARAQVQLAGGPLPAGTYEVTARIAARRGGAVRATLAGSAADVAPEHPAEPRARLTHAGGVLRFDVRVAGEPGADVWIDQLRLALLP
ncbi:MAG TPA: hypothetical protein VHM31_15650, partial [Polyangia bacterium]|nr:hypothetical protein [Polyangia bacterium]